MNRKIMKNLYDGFEIQQQTNQFRSDKKKHTAPNNPNNRIISINELPEWARSEHKQPNNNIDKFKANTNITDIELKPPTKKLKKRY